MLIIEPSENGQECFTCPFRKGVIQTCREDELNHDLSNQLDDEYGCRLVPICFGHSITIKPEYNGMD